MKCPHDGRLRAHLDGELEEAERKEMEEHVQGCERCQSRQGEIVETAREAGRRLEQLMPAGSGSGAADAGAAYVRFQQQGPGPVAAHVRWFRPVWGAVAAALTITLLLSFAPARSFAQHVLSLLRVQRVTVVPVDISAFSNGRDTSHDKMLAQMISDSMVVTEKPGAARAVPDLASASQMAGFDVLSIESLGAPQKIEVSGAGAFHTTLDRGRIEDLLAEVGRSDIEIPPSLDGSTIAVATSKMVHVKYGDCGSGDCVTFMEARSPQVSVPPDLNLAALAEAGLQLAGMSPQEAHAFAQNIDWKSTLVIPIPERKSTYRSVPVDGVDGTLVETAAARDRPAGYALIWVKDGMLYTLAGKGDASRVLAAAANLN